MPQSQLIAKYTEMYFSTLLPWGQQHLVVCCLHLPEGQENDRQEVFALSQMLLFHKHIFHQLGMKKHFCSLRRIKAYQVWS